MNRCCWCGAAISDGREVLINNFPFHRLCAEALREIVGAELGQLTLGKIKAARRIESMPPDPQKPTMEQEISRLFDHHPPTKEIIPVHEKLRELSKEFMREILKLPVTRERSVAITEFETATFWMHACIARNHDAIREILNSAKEGEGQSGDSGS